MTVKIGTPVRLEPVVFPFSPVIFALLPELVVVRLRLTRNNLADFLRNPKLRGHKASEPIFR